MAGGEGGAGRGGHACVVPPEGVGGTALLWRHQVEATVCAVVGAEQAAGGEFFFFCKYFVDSKYELTLKSKLQEVRLSNFIQK